jgi:hypothetical protein
MVLHQDHTIRFGGLGCVCWVHGMEGGQAGKEKSSVLIASMYFRASVFSALVYYMTNHEVSSYDANIIKYPNMPSQEPG